MIFSMAPMEGLTGYIFRKVHSEFFGPMDRYYTPFVFPRADIPFTKREQKDVDPANNVGLNVIPQLLSNNADAFVSGAERLSEMGYCEVNLNLGCPSGTVVGKGRGSGFLARPQELESFLQDICERSPVQVSVKTRLGLTDLGEYDEILDVYRRCPIKELIVHPRLRKDMYKGAPHLESYALTLEKVPFPVAYNGDIFSKQDMDALIESFPETRHVMLGRGIIMNPALPRELCGGPALQIDEFKLFHDALFGEYERSFGGNAVSRMKEWWHCAMHSFADPMGVRRLIRKTRTVDEYRLAVSRVFGEIELAECPSRP